MQRKEWQRPVVEETETGLEVTSYMPADLGRK
ncbi:MAG: pyrroloquinoline quinone precursor peptide PqqA [Hyphomicrobiales bacterium]|nr:pyrroloquinoline quinone precursor peptide PqqA [Hyphomicrobiales bacterium]